MDLGFSTQSEAGTQSGRPAGRGCGTLFFGLFFLMGAVFVVLILGETMQELAPWWWTQTECTISSSTVEETGDDEHPYRAAVKYRYEIDGRVRQGDRIVRRDRGSASYDRARDRAARYRPGTAVTCRVDPDQPALAVLEARGPWIALATLFPMIFVAIGAGGLYVVWRGESSGDGDTVESISQKARKGGSQRVGLAVGLVFVAVGGALFIFLFALPAVRLAGALRWSPTPCKVVSSSMRSWSTDDGTSYRADVMYEYAAGGRAWRSNQVDFFPALSSGRDGARAVLQRYPVGADVSCWVDDRNPSRSVLDRKMRPIHLLGLAPLIFLIAGAALAVHSRRALRTAARRPAEFPDAISDAEAGPVVLKPQLSPIGKVFGALFFALFWNGIVSIFVWQAWRGWQSGHPDWFLTVFLVPFVLVGLAAAVFVGHLTLALANPRPRLTLNRAAPCLGDELRIEWHFTGRASRIRHLRIVLEGREEATYRRGTDTVTDREVFMKQVLVDTANDWEIPNGNAVLAVPDDTMHSFSAPNNRIVWELKVAGDIARWPDVDQSFPITVYAMRPGEV